MGRNWSCCWLAVVVIGTFAVAHGEPPQTGDPPQAPPSATPTTPAAPPGVPASISFEIVDGTAQDANHAMFKTGSSLHLRAIIRDAYGNIINSTPEHPCTPVFSLEDAATTTGESRATIADDIITFGKGTGPFTVSVACAEHPEINSHGNTAPYNFETNNRSAFAREAHVTPAMPATPVRQSPSIAKRVALTVGVVLLAAAVGVLTYEVLAGSSGGSCPISNPCVCSYGGANCTDVGTSLCTSEYGIGECVSEDPRCTCDSSGHAARVTSVEQLVQSGARGMSRRTAPPAQSAAVKTPVSRRAPTNAAAAFLRSPGGAIGATFVAAAAGAALMLIIHDEHLAVGSWLSADSGGLTLTGRF